MAPEDRETSWRIIWERRRERCLRQEDVAAFRDELPPEALAILEEARALAALTDPAAHASGDAVDRLVERANALEGRAALLLHRPVCNGLTMLKIAAQQLLAGGAGAQPPLTPIGAGARLTSDGARHKRFDWLLVVGESEEVAQLARECAEAQRPPLPVRDAATLEAARARLSSRDGIGLVVTNLILPSLTGPGPHGLDVVNEARQHRHATLLVTAAGDYLDYWDRLTSVGLTGHDVIIKTRRDFADNVRRRLREIVRPSPLTMSYEEDTGHLVWVGDVEVSHLEAQEALALRSLDNSWQTPSQIVDGCGETELAPRPSAIPALISVLRRKLARALVDAESASAQGDVIETSRRDGMETRYRLAPWLRWVEPVLPAGAARSLPPVLVVEDDRDWSDWVTDFLCELRWPATTVATAEEAMRALQDGPLPIVVADLGLRDPATGIADPELGLRLIESMAAQNRRARVVVLSGFSSRDTRRARLFEAGVRTIDVIDKAAGREECRAVLLASLQRAADELWRGVRRAGEAAPGHHVIRTERNRVEVDGRPVPTLSPGEACVLEQLIRRPNQAVKADLIEAGCFPLEEMRPHASSGYNPLNKVQLTVRRLRQKIDRGVGTPGVGADVIRTPHRGARAAYELHGLVTDLAGDGPDA